MGDGQRANPVHDGKRMGLAHFLSEQKAYCEHGSGRATTGKRSRTAEMKLPVLLGGFNLYSHAKPVVPTSLQRCFPVSLSGCHDCKVADERALSRNARASQANV